MDLPACTRVCTGKAGAPRARRESRWLIAASLLLRKVLRYRSDGLKGAWRIVHQPVPAAQQVLNTAPTRPSRVPAPTAPPRVSVHRGQLLGVQPGEAPLNPAGWSKGTKTTVQASSRSCGLPQQLLSCRSCALSCLPHCSAAHTPRPTRVHTYIYIYIVTRGQPAWNLT